MMLMLGALSIVGCSSQQHAISPGQLAVLNEITAGDIPAEQVKLVEIEPSVARKFPAVDKMFKVSGGSTRCYGLLVSPQGYRAPINIMVVIDPVQNQVIGIKVLQQDETPGYGEWLAEDWFVKRFVGKGTDQYLKRVVLEAKETNDIIQITSATVTTQAVINGVNAAMGTYREVVLGQTAPKVPLKVKGYICEDP